MRILKQKTKIKNLFNNNYKKLNKNYNKLSKRRPKWNKILKIFQTI